MESAGRCNRVGAGNSTGGDMKAWALIVSAVGGLFHRRRMNDEIDEELRSHIEHRADDLERQGHARQEARRQARLSLAPMSG